MKYSSPKFWLPAVMGLGSVCTVSAINVSTQTQTSFGDAVALQTDDTFQAEAWTITGSPGGGVRNTSSLTGLRDAASSTDNGTATIAGDGSPGPSGDGIDLAVWDIILGNGTGSGWELEDIIIHGGIASGSAARQEFDFGIEYSVVGDETTFMELLAPAQYHTGSTAGTGIVISITANPGEFTNLHTLRFNVSDSPADGNISTAFAEMDINAIPEPSSMALLAGLGALGCLALRRREV